LFRSSGLYREKWERQDYREKTITNAIPVGRETFSPVPEQPTRPRPSTSSRADDAARGVACGQQQQCIGTEQ